MVTYQALRDADPTRWTAAANDWVTLSQQCEQSATDIYHQGAGKVTDHWKDEVGDLAVNELGDLANSYRVAGVTIRAVALVLEGLGESAQLAQRALQSAVDYARQCGLVIDEATGKASFPDTRRRTPDEQRELAQANHLISQATAAATQIDETAGAELNKLGAKVDRTSLDDAFADQETASQDQLAMFKETLPTGQSPELVRKWWDSLTDRQREEYERAVPVELYDLNGIPEDVKAELRGTDGYNAIDAIRWAQQNAHNKDIDNFSENCTNFISHAMREGGLPEKGGGFDDHDPDEWYSGTSIGSDLPDPFKIDEKTSSPSWRLADAQKQFLLGNGGRQIPPDQARPGDLVYFTQKGSGDTPIGGTHHVGLVTGVTPDGDIHYTQHNADRKDASLNGRMPDYQITTGQQEITVVRPKRTW
ncbi:amidase domain-containing protein [Amycolatopsis samaneae]|uniref:Amidase domain-containing protein n=1 Tax=Amycolatopsis samaneae TaxID=664691 RepID=A0ABW5GQT9_9PSEU